MNKTLSILLSLMIASTSLSAGIIGSNYAGASFIKTSEIDGYAVGANWAVVEDLLDVSVVGSYNNYDGSDSSIENQKLIVLSGMFYKPVTWGKAFVDLGLGYGQQEFYWGSGSKSLAFSGSVGVEYELTESLSLIPVISYVVMDGESDAQMSVGASLNHYLTETVSLGFSVSYWDTDVGGSSGFGFDVKFHF